MISGFLPPSSSVKRAKFLQRVHADLPADCGRVGEGDLVDTRLPRISMHIQRASGVLLVGADWPASAARARASASLRTFGIADMVGQDQDQPGVEQLAGLVREALVRRRPARHRSRPGSRRLGDWIRLLIGPAPIPGRARPRPSAPAPRPGGSGRTDAGPAARGRPSRAGHRSAAGTGPPRRRRRGRCAAARHAPAGRRAARRRSRCSVNRRPSRFRSQASLPSARRSGASGSGPPRRAVPPNGSVSGVDSGVS